jgi:glycerol-3-phosphate dehydrogenase (NAD(P)+)
MTNSIAVIGAGAWGTALATILAEKKQEVRLWEYFAEYAEVLKTTRENPKFLPGVKIPREIFITHDLAEAVHNCQTVILVSPSQKLRAVAKRLVELSIQPEYIVTASKGIENDTLQRMSEIVVQEFGQGPKVCALSGPSHAEEVSRRIPTSVVAASKDMAAAQHVQNILMTEQFRIYTSDDIVGVEMGGALKNVIAIAAGMVDGLQLGDNTKAALITRGLAEMRRLGMALKARPETFAGLSGLGDLVVTCTSRHSRNRRVGEELGQGKSLKEILAHMEMVAEGVETTRSVWALAQRLKVDMPITHAVNRILFENCSPQAALKSLLQRPQKSEYEANTP